MKERDYDLVHLTWRDAAGNNSWHSLEEAKAAAPVNIHTVGWLVKEDKRTVTIVGSYCRDGGVHNRDTIPKANITSKRILVRGRRP